MPDQFRVVCGTCGVNPNIISNERGEDEAVCPVCGLQDKAEVAIATAQEQLHYEAQIAFERGVGDAVKGREFIRFEPEQKPPRVFKWHVARI